MDEFETMRETCGLQHLARGDETCGIQTKLRVLSPAWRPFARALSVKTEPNSELRFHADFLWRADRLLKLFKFFGHDDDFLVELATKQRDADECRVFIAIANIEIFIVPLIRKRGDQFRLASCF